MSRYHYLMMSQRLKTNHYLLGLYVGLDGEYDGEVGEYDGDVGLQ